jgi:fatty-acyl-CoA synthase
LLDAADRVAHGLAKLGIEPTDRVGVWAMNCWEWLVVHMACTRAGAILVNLNPSCRAHELAFILKNSRMKVLFLRERDAKAKYAAVLDEVRRGADFALRNAIYFDTTEWEGLLAEEPRPAAARIDIDDVTNIQYTSGTTGSPKGVLLTHLPGGALCPLLRQRDRHNVGAGERVCAHSAERHLRPEGGADGRRG